MKAWPRRIHCVGLGGGGVSAIACLLADRGLRVSGSDSSASLDVAHFERHGVAVRRGHSPEHVADAELLIRSVAVPDGNPELRAAAERRLPVLKYSEALGRLMSERQGIAVAGTHGKTTTTALVTHLLRGAGADPGWIVGGRPLSLPGAAGWGEGPSFVAEACEFDRSFLNLPWRTAIITGIEPDHLDCFVDAAGVRAAFASFAARLPENGTLVCGPGVPADLHPGPLPVGARVWPAAERLQLVDLVEHADGWTGTVQAPGFGGGAFRWALPGRHNLENLRLGLLAALAQGLPLADLLPHVASFGGVARRLQDLGTTDGRGPAPAGVRVFDDFAHHPDALAAAAAALRARFPGRRLVAVFQPHQVSRTADFLDDFARSLQAFDRVLLCDIFVARDRRPERAQALIEALAGALGPRAARVGPASAALAGVSDALAPGDLCVVMGAGDIDGLAGRLAGPTAGDGAG